MATYILSLCMQDGLDTNNMWFEFGCKLSSRLSAFLPVARRTKGQRLVSAHCLHMQSTRAPYIK